MKFNLNKEIHAITLKIYFKNITVWIVNLCFLVNFNIILSFIFPENFTKTHQVSQKIWILISSILTIFVNFLDFFTFICYKKTNDGSIYNIISAVFWLGIILDKLLRNCNRLYSCCIRSSNMKVGSVVLTHPRQITFEKPNFRAIELK